MKINFADLSRRIVDQRLAPGEDVLDVRAGPFAAIVVTTHRALRVEQVEAAEDFGVDVVVLTTASTDVHGPVTPLAVGREGDLVPLADEEGLRTLWRQAAEDLPAEAMARLVAEWAGTDVGPRAVLEIEGAAPSSESGQQGRTYIVLHTRSPRQDGGDDVDRWDVILGLGILEWRHRPVMP